MVKQVWRGGGERERRRGKGEERGESLRRSRGGKGGMNSKVGMELEEGRGK